jgi:LuxR family maltose regulon positive regulatory protein
MCLFDEFTLEQVRFIWPNPGLEDLLSSLVARNAFVFFNTDTRRYQMHNILTIFLRDKLATSPQYSSYCQKAGQWFLTSGEHLNAMELFFLGKDFTSLLAALEQDKNKSIDDQRKFQRLLTFFEAIPEATLLAHPKSLLIFAMTAFTFNETAWMEKACHNFARAMQPLALSDASTHLWGEFHILNSFTHYNDILAMARELEKAQALMHRPTEFLDTSGSWSFGSPSIVLLFHREKGHLSEYERAMQESIHIYCELTQGHGTGAATLMAGEAAYLRGDFSHSASLCYRAQREAGSHPSPAIRIGALFLLLRLAIVQGHKEEVGAIFQQHRHLIETTRDPATVATLDLSEGFAFGLLRQPSRIASWLLDEAALTATLQFPCLPMGQIVLGRALLLRGEYSRFLGCFPRHLDNARFFPNLLAEIYAHIFRAAACEKLLRRPEAEISLNTALELAALDNLTMPFVENIDYLDGLLRRLPPAAKGQSFAHAILRQGVDYQSNLTVAIGEFQACPSRKLTSRELEVARLVASGLSNKEVAIELFISPNTVKTLLKNIFEKLGIKSRALLAQTLTQINQ